MREIRYIFVEKKNKTLSIETAKLDESDNAYTFITSQIGEQGELTSLFGLPNNIMLVYDDHYGWDKKDEDFVSDENAIASYLTHRSICGDCIICKIRDTFDDEAETPSFYDVDSLSDEEVALIYSKVYNNE